MAVRPLAALTAAAVLPHALTCLLPAVLQAAAAVLCVLEVLVAGNPQSKSRHAELHAVDAIMAEHIKSSCSLVFLQLCLDSTNSKAKLCACPAAAADTPADCK